MFSRVLCFCSVLLMVAGCTDPSGSGASGSSGSDPATPTAPEVTVAEKDGRLRCMEVLPDTIDNQEIKAREFREHAASVKTALGDFNDITVHEWDAENEQWKLVSGQYVPVTVDGKEPAKYHKEMRSDRPMMLPTRVQGFQGGDGQSSPYSVAGRMPGSNPEVQWVFVVRQYSIKKPSDADFNEAGDIAIIGHHPRTGATAFFQYYDPAKPKAADVVYSPSSENGPWFWSPVDKLAAEFRCERCHASDAFIHTPWVNQVRVKETGPDEPPAEAMVPSSPLGPYFFIDSGPGERFECWNYALEHLDVPDNKCTQCHRVTPYDLAGLGENSTRYAGLEFKDRNPYSIIADLYQSDAYYDVTWMPALDLTNFYAGQQYARAEWQMDYGESAEAVNRLTLEGLRVVSDDCWVGMPDDHPCLPPVEDPRLAEVPRPPEQYRTIVVDRPEQDAIAANQSVWIVDTRMRANTDGDLHQWRYFAKAAAGNTTAAPVVYRRKPGDGSQLEFEVRFVGEPRSGEPAETWLALDEGGQTIEVQQGDYFGLVLSNTGSDDGTGIVPYTTDDWAKLKWPDGSSRYHDGAVVYRVTLDEAPAVGDKVQFKDADYRTYSFELQNKL